MKSMVAILGMTLVFFTPVQSLKDQPRVEWFEQTKGDLREALKLRPNMKQAKNVIFFLGDGLGVSSVTAARIYNGQNRGLSLTDAQLSFEKLPHGGLLRTYSVDRMVPESASTAGAMLSGEKTKSNTIGVNQNVPVNRCDLVEGNTLTSILKHAHNAGKWTGLVTDTRITHASPAQNYGISPNRTWETDAEVPIGIRDQCKDLALQLIEENDYIRVVLGGGRTKFLPKETADPEYPDKNGEREDGRDLIQEWKDKKAASPKFDKYAYVQNKEEFDRANANSLDYLLGFFEPSDMKFEVDRINKRLSKWEEPSLVDMTVKAIQMLKRSTEGYFLFVEGGRIDHAHHMNNAFRALNNTVVFSDAIQAALDMVDLEDTLLLATADHSHVFTIGGDTPINNPIYGIAQHEVGTEVKDWIAYDGLPFSVLGYTNGPSWVYHSAHNGTFIAGRRNLTQDKDILENPNYPQQALVPLLYETHAGEDVGIYAGGPWAHLFSGTHENSYVAHVMMYAMCVGPGLTLCSEDSVSPPWNSVSPAPVTCGVCGITGSWVMPLVVALLVRSLMENVTIRQ